MYKMAVDFPNLAKGAEVQIDGLGIFKNGYSHTIDDDLAQSYRVHRSFVVDEVNDKGEITSRKLEQGPTLHEAFKHSEGITVTSPSQRRRSEPPVIKKTKQPDQPADESPAKTKGDDK